MANGDRRKIVRLLGVGFDAADGHMRLTRGERHDVLMGSEESHEYLSQLILKIEKELAESGLNLDGISPEELTELIKRAL